VSGDTVRKLAGMGLTIEQIGGVMDIIGDIEKRQQEADEARKKVARDRVQRWRDKQNVTVTLPERNGDATERLTHEGARGEDNLLPKKISGQEERKKDAAPKALSDVEAFRADLLKDATPEQVEAFIKHRKAKSGQNSAYAAKLFRRDAVACSLSVSEAIDMAVSRNWLTVKPEYLNGARRGNGQGPPQELRSVGELAIHRLETGQIRDEPTGYANGRVDQRDERGQAESPRSAQLIALTANALGRIK